MIPALFALVLLADAGQIVLRDEVNVVPPGERRYDEFALKEQLPVNVECEFSHDAPVRVELMTRESYDALQHERPYEAIATAREKQLRQEIGVPGRFVLVVFNEAKSRPATVHLKLSLDFATDMRGEIRYLDPRRKLTVILLSFAGFVSIVTLSARLLLRGMRG